MIETAREVYGAEPVGLPTLSGSGPWYELCSRWGMDACAGGVGHARADAHGPNENIVVTDFVRGIKHVCAVIDRFARI